MIILNLRIELYNNNIFIKKKKKKLKVKDYKWEDHHSPPIDTLFIICNEIHNFLKINQNNVVIIHCLAGKGRTGSIICCYLMYCGRLHSP